MPTNPTSNLADPAWRRARAKKAGEARTTPEYHLERIREIVKRTRTEQGLPPTVVDSLTLGSIAQLIAAKGGATDAA